MVGTRVGLVGLVGPVGPVGLVGLVGLATRHAAAAATGWPVQGDETTALRDARRRQPTGGALRVSSGAGPGNNPDGSGAFSMTNYGDSLSAPMNVRVNALLGMFLSAASPTGASTPAQLDFAGGLNFAALAPGLGQIFFIGDGLTSDSALGGPAGAPQDFTVPSGATRLFLGSADGFGWFNNSGSFDVAVNVAGAITPNPLPAPGSLALALLALALLAIGLLGWRRASSR
jgi:hypothetical protein